MNKFLLIFTLLTFGITLGASPFIGVWKTDQNNRVFISTNSKFYYEYENILNPNISGSGTTEYNSLNIKDGEDAVIKEGKKYIDGHFVEDLKSLKKINLLLFEYLTPNSLFILHLLLLE